MQGADVSTLCIKFVALNYKLSTFSIKYGKLMNSY